jgi:hypothetical protein
MVSPVVIVIDGCLFLIESQLSGNDGNTFVSLNAFFVLAQEAKSMDS